MKGESLSVFSDDTEENNHIHGIGENIADKHVSLNMDINNNIAIGHQGKDFAEIRLDKRQANGGKSGDYFVIRNTNDSLPCLHAQPKTSQPVSERTPESQMYTLTTTILERQAKLAHHQVTEINSTIGNSINHNSSDKNQRVTSSLDLVDLVKGRSKAVSPCQSLAARVFSWRSMMLLLLHLSFVINIIPKNTAPIAIVCMVSPTSGKEPGLGSTNATTSSVTEGVLDHKSGGVGGDVLMNKTSEQVDGYEFDWDSNTVGLVLSAISFTSWVGPLFTDVIRGYLGNKWALTLITLGSALTTLLTPLAARVGPNVLVGLRVISGLSSGGNSPIVADTMAWWTPESERLTATTVTFSGFNMAGIITFFIAGFLCSVPIDNGWPFVFYVFGAVTLVWTLAWHIMSSQKPEDHPWISEEEKLLIITKRSVSVGSKKEGKSDKPPYRQVLTSVPIIAYILVTSVHMWSLTIIYTYIPVYFSRLLGFTHQETGVLVSCVAFCRLFGAFVWTFIGNMLMKRPGMTTNKNRKFIFTAGSLIAGILLVAVTFVNSDLKWLAASLMFVVMLSQSVSAVVVPALVLDMAPRYAGFISGITTSIACAVAISGPLMVAALTPTNSQSEWVIVWLIIAAAAVFSAVLFLVFGQASPLPWADNSRIPTPHVISPFVELGRRMTLFLEAPILTLANTTANDKFAPTTGTDFSGVQLPEIFLGQTKRTYSDTELASGDKRDLSQHGEYNPTFQPDISILNYGFPHPTRAISVQSSDHDFNHMVIDGDSPSKFENRNGSINGVNINNVQLNVAEETCDVRL